MIKIEYPPFDPKIKKEEGKELIFDEVRRRWVALTPEEWVRQNFLQYLVQVKKYPVSLIAVEKEFWLNDVKKRFDIVVYDVHGNAWMLIECKEMNVPLTTKTIEQLLRYDIVVSARYLVVTNGQFCVGFKKEPSGVLPIDELPTFA